MSESLNDRINYTPLAGQLTKAQGKQIADAIRNHKVEPTGKTRKALRKITGSPLATPVWRD